MLCPFLGTYNFYSARSTAVQLNLNVNAMWRNKMANNDVYYYIVYYSDLDVFNLCRILRRSLRMRFRRC